MKRHSFKDTETLDGLLIDWFGRGESFTRATDEARLHWEKTLEEGSALSEFFLKETVDEEEKYKELFKIGNEYLNIMGVPAKVTFIKHGGATNGKTVAVGTDMFDKDKGLTFHQALDIYIGVVIHEGLHMLHTDFANTFSDKFTKYVCNCIEDERIETAGGQEFPGFMGFISKTKYYTFKKYETEKLTLMQRFLNVLCGCVRFPLTLDKKEVELFGYYLLRCKEIIGESKLETTNDSWEVARKILEVARDLYIDEEADRKKEKDKSESKETDKPEDEDTPESDKQSDEEQQEDGESTDEPSNEDSGESEDSDDASESSESDDTDNSESGDDEQEGDGESGEKEESDDDSEGSGDSDTEEAETDDEDTEGESTDGESEDSDNDSQTTEAEDSGAVTESSDRVDFEDDINALMGDEEDPDMSESIKSDRLLSDLAEGRAERGSQPNTFVEKASNGKDDTYYREMCKRAYKVGKSTVDRYVPSIRKTLSALIEEHEVKFYGMRNGKLDPSKLVEARQGVPNVYTQQHKNESQGATIVLLVDESGSMGGNREQQARNAAILINESLKGLKGIDLYIYGHTADRGRYSKGHETNVLIYKEGSRDKGHDEDLARISAKLENRDGDAILEVATRVRKRTQNKALYLVLSDGQPSAGGYWGKNAIEDTKQKIAKASKMDFDIVGVTIDSYEAKGLYPEELHIENVSELPVKLARYIKKYITRNI